MNSNHNPSSPFRRCAKLLVFQDRCNKYGQLIGYECTNEPGLPVSEEELQLPRKSLLDVDPNLLRSLTEVLNKGGYDDWKVHSIVEKRPLGNQAADEEEEFYQTRMGTPSPRLPRRHSEMLYEQGPPSLPDRYLFPDRVPRGRHISRELASPVMNAEYFGPPKCQFNILIEGEGKGDMDLIYPPQHYPYPYPPAQHSAQGAPPR
ncbi:MAG: hypothetical protein M1840_001289 [Geoglossum simile]|nr:MAG: hypothetical protein M1840_001289 [Geoglossum simile]